MNLRHTDERDDNGYRSDEVEFEGTPDEWFALCEKQPRFAEASMGHAIEAMVMRYTEEAGE